MHDQYSGNIAAAAQARVLIIDYRLAPEHPFPAGLEDVLTSYRWLLAQGIKPSLITLAGDSAGGGLVLSALLVIRQQGMALPGAGVCMSPATNLAFNGESWQITAKKDLMIDPYTAGQIRPLYLGSTDPCDPLVSPIFGD